MFPRPNPLHGAHYRDHNEPLPPVEACHVNVNRGIRAPAPGCSSMRRCVVRGGDFQAMEKDFPRFAALLLDTSWDRLERPVPHPEGAGRRREDYWPGVFG